MKQTRAEEPFEIDTEPRDIKVDLFMSTMEGP